MENILKSAADTRIYSVQIPVLLRCLWKIRWTPGQGSRITLRMSDSVPSNTVV